MANIILAVALIVVDYFIGIELKSFAIGVLTVLCYEPLAQNIKKWL